MTTITLVLSVTLLTAANGSQGGTVGERLSAEIVEKGYKRVGILPRFISRVPGGEESLGGSIGPQAEKYAEELEEDLTASAGDRFQVVEGRRMKKAFGGLTIDDLSNKEALAKVADRVDGLDALVVGTVVDEREATDNGKAGGLNVRCQLIGLKDGSVAGVAREKVGLTLSDGAYMGESWELRRWTDDGLQNVGLTDPDDSGSVSPFGAGAVYEASHYAMIRRGGPHPLLDPKFPYPLEVVVGGQPRKPVQVEDKLYVALDPGEVYKVRLKSQGPRVVYTAVFVDGINILGKARETPASCRFWNLAAGSTALFGGWVSGDEGKFREEEFMITQADETVAAGQGFSQSIGLITAVFFTVGMKDVPEAPKTKAAIVGGTFGTGTSNKTRDLSLEMKAGEKPGLILAAVSLRYATSSQLKKLQAPSAPVEK